jgi:hypothetical protein
VERRRARNKGNMNKNIEKKERNWRSDEGEDTGKRYGKRLFN